MNPTEGYSILFAHGGVARFEQRPEGAALQDVRRLGLHLESLNGTSDDRQEIKDTPRSVQELAKSVALLCDAPYLIKQANGGWELDTRLTGLLSSERFWEQPAVPHGFSGFLVGEDLLLTTAHQVEVSDLRIVFGYQLGPNGVAKTSFAANEVFSATELDRIQDPSTREDWLLLRLDHSPGRPFPALNQAQAPFGTPLRMFGHPLGLPMKFVDNAKVTLEGAPVFQCDLDAGPGNSGSMVLGPDSRVVGVLRGAAPAVGAGVWLWCGPNGFCPTSVTGSAAFAAAVQKPRGPV